MSDERHSHPNYVVIWVILVVLTVVSIAVGKYVEPKQLAISILFVNSAIKALLVALNFMHLKFEKLIIVLLVLTPLVLFLVFVLGSLPDTLATPKL